MQLRNRNGIQKQIQQKKTEKTKRVFLIVQGHIKPNIVPLQLQQ